MSRYYKILEKARRSGELFNESDGGAQEPVVNADAPLADAGEAPVSFADIAEDGDSSLAGDEEQRVDWRQILAEETGSVEPLTASRLCLFGFDDRSLAPVAVAAGQWMARHSETPVLLVEADWRRSSGVAGVLQLRRRGLGDMLNDPDARIESLIYENAVPNLAVLASGSTPSAQGARLAQKVAGVLSGLRRRFPTVLLVLPSTSTRAWKHYAEAGLADAGLLVVRPQSANRRRAQRGMKLVSKHGVQVVGCLLDIARGEQASLRLSQLAPSQPSEPAELDL